MKKSTYVHGLISGRWYDFSEIFAKMILNRKLPSDMEIEKKAPYGDGPREVANLIYNKDRSKKQPLLLYIHGGGWISGGPNLRNNYCAEFVKKGFFAANIDYELAPRKVFPYQVQQCFKAIDFLYDNAEKYNIDMSKILLAGESAGAYFLYYLSAMANDKTLFDKLGIEFRHKDEFKPSAIISICGAIDILRLTGSKFPDIKIMLKSFTGKTIKELKQTENEDIALFSPQISSDTPPSMVIYARHDLLRYESFALIKQLEESGVAHKTFEGKGIISMHAFPIATIERRGKECLKETMDFILPYFE